MKKLILSALIPLLTFFSSASYGYVSLLSTGDVLQQNQVQVLGYLQGIFNKYDGVTANVRGSLGLTDSLQAELELGLGEFDYMLGAYIKWVPIPDTNNQPAIGVRAGLNHVDVGSFTQTTIVAMPFVSKNFETDIGLFQPFTGIPFGINTNRYDTDFTARLAVGTQWTHADYRNMHAIGEVGFGWSHSFSSMTLGGSFDF